MGATSARRRAEAVTTSLAARQHGIVSRRELLRAGIRAHSVDNLLRSGAIEAVHRGVYRVGPILATRSREMAALLACGKGSAISHWSAAAIWQLSDRVRAKVEVIMHDVVRSRRPGIVVHRATTLRQDEVTRLEGVAVTTIPRTLLDLASVATQRQLERALAQAEHERALSPEVLGAMLTRHPNHPGRGRLQALLESDMEPAFTRSEAEERMLALIRKSKLRAPETNVRVQDCEVDFLWRIEQLVVEVDGFAFHRAKHSFEIDRRRDADLAAGGFRVMRVTWRQIAEEPEALLVRLAQALAR